MTYEEFSNRVSDYLDGDMTPAQRAEMEHQAARSPACKALLEDVGALSERLKRLPREEPSAGFNFALRSHLLMEVAKEQQWARRVFLAGPVRRTVFAAAAALVLGLGLNAIWQNGPEQPLSGVGEIPLQSAGSPQVLDHRGSLKRLANDSQPISGRQVQQVYGSVSDSAVARKRQPIQQVPEVRQMKVKF